MSANDKTPSFASPAAVPRERMPQIPADRLTEEQKEIIADVLAGPRGVVRGPWYAMMRSPGLMEQAQKFGEYVRFKSPLAKRLHEMIAILVARQWTNQYEWAAHYSAAVKAGLSPLIAEAIAEARRPDEMAEDEEALYNFVSEIFNNKSVSDPTYARAIDKFGEPGVIEIIGVISYYTMLAMVMNVARTTVVEHPAAATPLVPLPLQP